MYQPRPIKVMFVDDEDKMRGLLRICIPWEELDYEIVNDVSSANQALELIACDNPDVIITDIEMPFINGLDFAEMVLEEHPFIKIVALTAHDEFDYAKQGLEIGISNFLLKPIKKEELIRVMTDIRNTIREEQKKLYQHELLQRKLNENRSFIIQNFLSNMMVSSLPSDYLWENLAYYQIPLHQDSGFFNVLLLTLNVSQDIEESILQQFQCKEIILSAATRISGVLVFQDIHMNLILLIENRKINLYNYGFHFSTLIKDRLGIESYVGVGTPVECLEDIPISYRQAYQNAQVAKYSHNKSFLANPPLERNHQALQNLINTVTEELSLFMQIPQEDTALQRVKKAYDSLEYIPGHGLSDIMVLSLSIVNIVLTTLRDKGISYSEIYNTDHLPYTNILKLTDEKDIKQYVIQMVHFTLHQINLYTDAKGNKLIHTILQYINENLAQSTLTLKKIAEMNYVNPSYLSRIFKEVTHMNFIDYLTSIRIEKAKRLLQNSCMRIYEIAEAVGISDPNYFSKLFKKCTNKTPAQYKDEMQQQEDF